MNPFDHPPTTPPVSFDPPSGASGSEGPRRGRMALAALAAAGLVGGGLVVAGQFASADRPSLESASDSVASVEEPPTTVPDGTGDDSNDGTPDDTPNDSDDAPAIDGEIVIDDGDGDPMVIDLGEIEGHVRDLSECLGGSFLGDGPLFDLEVAPGERLPLFDEEFEQRMEEFLDGLPWDDLGGELDDGVRIFGSGGSTITVVGPDGLEVIDLGEGDATVTIEQTDGEVTIETDGDATVTDLPDIGSFLPGLDGDDLEGLDDLELGDLDLGDLNLGELLPFDLDEVESCLDELD